MNNHSFNYIVKYPFYSPDRLHQALIIILDNKGRIVLAEKKGYYPDGIYRFFGGRVDNGENPRLAAIREIKEELNIDIHNSDLKDVMHIESNMEIAGTVQTLITDIYFYEIGIMDFEVGDDVSGYTSVTLDEFEKLITRMSDLQGEYSGQTKGKSVNFYWNDWGQVNSKIHQLAYDYIVNRNESSSDNTNI